MTELHPDAINALIYGDHGAPFTILGPHTVDDETITIRAFRPHAKTLHVVHKETGKRIAMKKIHKHGLFEATVDQDWGDTNYCFEETTPEKETYTFDDPYRFPPLLTDYDLYLLGEGRHFNSYDRLGAHLREVDGVTGVNFAVWAPNARRVSVIGDFNKWDGRVHPMQMRESGGIWELFIPGLDAGTKYKFELVSHNQGYFAQKSDPYGFFAEVRPNTASIVADLDDYTWGDDQWMQARAERDHLKSPLLVYEVHLGSWKHNAKDEWLTYRELAHDLVQYVKDMGYTHIELLPVAEHPLDGSWGYQVTGYFAPTSRFGTPQDFMYFVDQCHQNGIGVILDWVPAHFPKDGYALSYFDGTHLYEHSDSRLGEHPDWGTYIFNYGRNEVRNFLIANALFWLKTYHIDGLRVDAVSSMLYLNFGREDGNWLPNQYGGHENLDAIRFLQEANAVIHTECPGTITIAEESTSWPMVSRPTYLGGLGFTLKWNMGWMHDTLKYMQKEPIYRRYHHNDLTFAMMYAFSENFVLALSHDEVVHGKGSIINKMSGDWWQKFANVRLLMGYQIALPGKILNFMGSEFGQWREWSEARSLDWHLVENFETHKKLQQWVKDLNHLYQNEPALHLYDFEPRGFRWIEANDADQSVYSFIRYGETEDDFLVIVCNFTPVPRELYRVGVPAAGYYQEVLNSDSQLYGGSNMGNAGGRQSEAIGWNGFDQSLHLTLPPLSILILKKIE